jgi:hypothetical protein
MFIRSYSFYVINNGAAPTNLLAPPTFDIGSINPNGGTLTYDQSANTIAFTATFPLETNSWQVENGLLVLQVSQPGNASRNFRMSRFTNGSGYVVPAVPVANVVMPTAASPFVYQAGQHVWFRLRAIHPDNRLTEATYVGPKTVVVVP